MLPTRQSGLAVVLSCYYLHEADVARALLESEGIEAWILDEHQIRQRWHLAGALGGVKLAVAPQDAARARQLLAEDRSSALGEIEEQVLPPHEDELCPRCGAASATHERQRLPGPVQWATSLFFLLLGLLVPRRRVEVRSRCGSCGFHGSYDRSR